MPKITPFLWYDTDAEEAAKTYVSLIPNSKILEVSRYGEGAPMPAGSAMTVRFQIDGQELLALNGGPHYKHTPAFSLVIHCETQEEVDRYWEKLGAGGRYDQCGWLQDKWGLSWQITPVVLPQLLQDKDKARAGRAMAAMMGMQKLDIAALKRAADGK
jgi:predicted 3-demethylubiquinone-9 3-methyltransferase (glyoxalase superfamily)